MAAAPNKHPSRLPSRESATTPAPAPSAAPTGPAEIGWLPDCVYTGEKFETNLAFFADSLGRITRFSREPADLAKARRLAGQAALPGMINGHSASWQRVLRGRAGTAGWHELCAKTAGRLSPEDLFEAARLSFMEMMLSGITCVGEFHELRNQPDGSPSPEPGASAQMILRAAREAGIRIALFNVATIRDAHGRADSVSADRARSASADAFVRETELLRAEIAGRYATDEAWLGVAPESLASVPLDQFKTIAAYARSQRMRLQMRTGAGQAQVDACVAEYGRTPVAVLAEHGLVDKRLTVLHGTLLGVEECRLLGAARACVCTCPASERTLAIGTAPVEALLAAGAVLALGSGTQDQIDLLKNARLLEYGQGIRQPKPAVFGTDPARALFHAATVAGARSLGATGGALEVGRPADFFTVNLFDPSIAGADPGTLLANLVFSVERRAIREVWIGARQVLSNGRHPNQGLIVGRFVDMQRRLWPAQA